MMYDVHTHVGMDPAMFLRGWWPYAATAQDLLGHMDAHGIDRAVCFPFVIPSAFDPYVFAERFEFELLPGRAPYDRENALLCQECERIDLQRRLRVLAMFDPARCVDEQMRNLEPLKGRITGLKTQTEVTRSPIKALLKEGRALMAFAERHDMPVLVHTAVVPTDRFSRVEDCLEVAAAYPKVRFNLAHSLRFHAGFLRQAAATPNVWVDCSAHLAHCQLARDNHPAIAPKDQRVDADYTRPTEVLAAVHAILGGRYLWGSDTPYMSWCDDAIRAVFTYGEEVAALRALPDAARRSMADEAPRAWLGKGC